MVISLILIEGKNVNEEALVFSLQNAKQIVIGKAQGFGTILHIAATTPGDLREGLLKYAQVPGVTEVTILATRSDWG